MSNISGVSFSIVSFKQKVCHRLHYCREPKQISPKFKMKILIDNSPLTQDVCGIYRYAECIIPRLIKKLPENSIKLCPVETIMEFYKNKQLVDPSLYSGFSKLDKNLSKAYCELKNRMNLINKGIKEGRSQYILRDKLERELLRLFKGLVSVIFPENKIIKGATKDIDIYHNLYNYFPDEIKKSKTIKKCITVMDIIPAVRPDLVTNSKKSPFQKQIQQFKELTNEEIIFTISEYSKYDLCNFNKKINPSNVHVTYLAADEKFKPAEKEEIQAVRAKYKIPVAGQYIFSTLTSDPKKNMPFVIKGFEELIRSDNIDDLYLVLSGNIRIANMDVINDLDSDIRSRVILTGYVEDEDVSVLHSGSLCFCFPSLYEGFGIPVLEAMQCGTPVITSNVSSLPEIAGDAAILIDPLDRDALVQAMLNLYKDSNLRKVLSNKGLEQAKKFSWDFCTDKMVEVYKKYSNSI